MDLACFEHSPFLTQLAARHPEVLARIHATGHDACFQAILQDVQALPHALPVPELMQTLRRAKAHVAQVVAHADIAKAWGLSQVTEALSAFACAALEASVSTLLTHAAARGDITLPDPSTPTQESGLIVLGMGKLGANELNYSSDIDLILFYESGALNYAGRHTEQKFFNTLAQDLVQIMQERTPRAMCSERTFACGLTLPPPPLP